MCCGRKRSMLRHIPSGATEVPLPGAPQPNLAVTPTSLSMSEPSPSVTLYYVETRAIRVWGPVTKRPYEFSGAHPTQPVDPRDAAILARSRFFRRAGGL